MRPQARLIAPLALVGLVFGTGDRYASAAPGERSTDLLSPLEVIPDQLAPSTIRRLGAIENSAAVEQLLELVYDLRFPAEAPETGRALVEALYEQLRRRPRTGSRVRERLTLALVEFVQPSTVRPFERAIPERTAGTALRALGASREPVAQRLLRGLVKNDERPFLANVARETLAEFFPEGTTAENPRKPAASPPGPRDPAEALTSEDLLSLPFELTEEVQRLEVDEPRDELVRAAQLALVHSELVPPLLQVAERFLASKKADLRSSAAFAFALHAPSRAKVWLDSSDAQLRSFALNFSAKADLLASPEQIARLPLALALALELEAKASPRSTRALRHLESFPHLLPFVRGLLAARVTREKDVLAPPPSEVRIWFRSEDSAERAAVAFGLGSAPDDVADGLLLAAYERELTPLVRRTAVLSLRRRHATKDTPQLVQEKLARISVLDPDRETRLAAASGKVAFVQPEILVGRFRAGPDERTFENRFALGIGTDGHPRPIFLDENGFGGIRGLSLSRLDGPGR